MIRTYGVYGNKEYELEVNDGQLELTSHDLNDKQNGFTEYVDVLGNKHNDLLIKLVKIDELKLAFEVQLKVKYKGNEYETYSLGMRNLEENRISLVSMDSDDVEKYGFEKQEQFVFKKEVSLDDIEALIEIKKPILTFKENLESRSVIPGNLVREYLKRLE
ncbi:hypothetical protein V7068_03395 [Bacillus sp. JJ634]